MISVFSFFSKLENPYPTSFFEEAAEFTRDMEAHRQLMADQISEQKPGPPPAHSRVTRLDQLSLEDEAVGSAAQCASAPVGVQSEALKGGSVAALVGLMFDEPSSLVRNESRLHYLSSWELLCRKRSKEVRL